MGEGKVVSIYTAPAATAPMWGQPQVQAVAGKGLEGDRYFSGTGTFWKPRPDYEVTLIEIEAIEALERDYGVSLAPGESRRNIVTRGVALNHLVGREFQIGEVTLRGIRLCEPCAHLQRLTREGVIKGLAHRGGLRAQVLNGGTIAVDDRVAEVPKLTIAD
ncbi:MAG TPA: MOSC domain-containing protein [Terriglobia bacterium]|nr:MOSC domain-containing protein [Terriglobia bacterium]